MPKPWHQRQKEQGVKLVLSWFAPPKVLEEVSRRRGQVFQAARLGRGLRSSGA